MYRPRRCLTAIAAAVGLTLLLGAQSSLAQSVYRWVDSRGVVHFTNVGSDARYSPVAVFKQSSSRRLNPRPSNSFDSLIERAAKRQGVPAGIVKAVIHAESAFDPLAVSHKGAMGLMQLMPATARSLGVEKPFRVVDNISAGSRYLRMMHERYANWPHALAAYNAGPRAVDRYRGIPPYDETREYVRRVLTYYRRYDAEFRR